MAIDQGPTTTPTSSPGRQQITFPVTGMTCASCVRRIERALSKVDGVQEVSVNLATEKARVTYDPAAASIGQLKAAVERAGYGVGDLPAEAKQGENVPAVGSNSAITPEGDVTLPIEGMTCAS